MSVSGAFWMPNNPGVRVGGEFRAEAGEQPEAVLTANLVDDPRVAFHQDSSGRVTGFSVSAQPARSVASFLSVTLHGQLDTGELVTLLDAQNYGGAGHFAPRYRALGVAVVGATVSEDQLYSAVRFRMDRPHWTGHMADGDSHIIEDDGSELTVQSSQDGNWLVYESAAPTTLRRLEIRVVSGCLALLQLALYPDHDRVTRETEVRIGSECPWLKLRGPAFYAEPSGPEHETLLTRDHLTVAILAEWIELHTRLDGLPMGYRPSLLGRGANARSNTFIARGRVSPPVARIPTGKIPGCTQGCPAPDPRRGTGSSDCPSQCGRT